jgi:hypothetical protein
VIRPVPDAADRLARKRAEGVRVAFLSDMYLADGVIPRLLNDAGLLEPGETCYVSGDTGLTKQSGAAFRDLARLLGTEPGAITHEGDDERSDVRAAREAGVKATAYLRARLNRYERLLERHSAETGGLASVLAGASRLARLRVSVGSERDAAIRDVAAGVIAPTLVAFVLWTVLRAERCGLQRLYHVSRDGQILLPIARRLSEALGLGLENRYCYGGRQAWHLAAVREFDAHELAWATAPAPGLTVREVLRRLDVGPGELEAALRASAGVPRDWDEPLSDPDRDALAGALLEPDVRRILARHADERRELALAYLAQEGMLDGTPAGLVDIGWYGNALRSLNALVSEGGGSCPHGFFFGLLTTEQLDVRAPAHAYFIDRRSALPAPAHVPSLPILMETFTAGAHGPVLGYRRGTGRIEPRLASEVNDPVVGWGLPLVHEVVEAYCDALLLDPALVPVQADLRPAVGALLRAFWCEPWREEVEVWGEFPWEADQAGGRLYPLAEPHSPGDLVEALRSGWIAAPRASSWPAGSLAVTSRPLRTALRGVLRLRELSGRLTRVPGRLRRALGGFRE